jgi:hypothetical protein
MLTPQEIATVVSHHLDSLAPLPLPLSQSSSQSMDQVLPADATLDTASLTAPSRVHVHVFLGANSIMTMLTSELTKKRVGARVLSLTSDVERTINGRWNAQVWCEYA